MKRQFWILLCVLAVAGGWLFWPRGGALSPASRPTIAVASTAPAVPAAAPRRAPVAENSGSPSAASTNRLAFRLTNTPKSIGELTSDRHAILLENALILTDVKADLKIPQHLRASGEPGAFIVQSRGPIDAAFRAALAGAGGQMVSYIPNNAYLVQLSAGGAAVLQDNPQVQAVLPYEPYYKVQSSLLGLAVNQKPLPAGMNLVLGLFGSGAAATEAQIESLGGEILSRDRSPFGSVVRVRPGPDWLALAQLPGVQLVEPARQTRPANDLSRVTVGVAVDTVTNVNYLGLSGSNVLVTVVGTGVDATHPDFSTGGNPTTAGGAPVRVIGLAASDLVDTVGHETFVAAEIAGNGSKSISPVNVGGVLAADHYGSVTNADFRGKAPLATLFSMQRGGYSQSQLQEQSALTNSLIQNNSWNNGGSVYDLDAASYDAATRDAVPKVTGPQPVLFVFPAGNDGGGQANGSGGNSDSIESPGTAKNVITVGGLEQYRNITNLVTALDGTSNAVWQAETDSGSQVAAFSGRGNVGIGTEGASGRFKPDVVAPGTFVVSARSQTWDTNAYYNPTNDQVNSVNTGQIVDTNNFGFYQMTIPSNTVGIILRAVPNSLSPTPFPTLQFCVSATDGANLDPADPATYDFSVTANTVSIPPDGNLQSFISSGVLSFAVVDTVGIPVDFDLVEDLITTNDNGNYNQVLSDLNNTLGPYYRFETGTSMAAADVSGTLALMQDFFTNTLRATPSPALLKAMLINGARVSGNYRYAVTNGINLQGWGLVNLPGSIPAALTNTAAGALQPMFFADQSPTNVLATGDSRTYTVTVPAAAQGLPLRLTLVWTDPPGNPAAALKLVNNLDLVVTNLDTGLIYYGNHFAASDPPYTVASQTNDVPALDSVNNVENIVIPPLLGTNYSVTVIGRSVNVNAVTTEQTNIVQDYALVIACADAGNTNGITVAAATPVSSLAPQIDYVGGSNTNGIFFNQLSGANAPLLSTNVIVFGTNSAYATNAVLYLGQTNQWHFYVVTNTTAYTNAAFITFIPNTLAIPREGVFAGSDANSTRPEADLDLYVADGLNDPAAAGLTNLDPVVISNCIYGVKGDGAALSRGGTEFIAYSNSVPGQVYYVGVKCEDQMAGEYGFLGVFSQNPFSQQDTNGNVFVNGLNLPVAIPDGNNQHPGVGYVFGLCLQPIEVRNVVVTNVISHQNFGDLAGFFSHSGAFTTLNNHDSLGPVTNRALVYDDGGTNEVPGAIRSDGPGSLQNFTGQPGMGLWILTELDDAPTHTGSVTGLSFKLEPHIATNNALIVVVVPAGGWFYDYVDVPVGFTNLTVAASDETPPYPSPVLLALQFGSEPTLTNNLTIVGLTNGPLQNSNSISWGPPLTPGRYYLGLYNPDVVDHVVLLGVTLAFSSAAISTVDYDSAGPVPLLDDAVTYDSIFVTNSDAIGGLNIGLRVDHPRISDLSFTLIRPDGTRYLLMENRGADSTNGCGSTVVTTNIVNVTANGTAQPNTNYINTGSTSGTFPITYNFYTAPDEMTIYYGQDTSPANLIFDTGVTNNPSLGPGAQNTAPVTIQVPYGPVNGLVSTYLTIVMDQFLPTNRADLWTYTAGGVFTNFEYLTFTEDTNLTTTPIKFAPPPFVPSANFSTNSVLSDFESVAAGDYVAPATMGVWSVVSNQVSVVDDPATAQGGNNFLALANGTISNSISTVPGVQYTLTFSYRGPGAVSFWRAEGSAGDSLGANPGVITNVVTFAPGQVGTAFQFPGTNSIDSRVDIGDPANLRFTNSFSIDGWVNVHDFPGASQYGIGQIFFRGDTRSGLDPYYLAVIGSGAFQFHLEDGTGSPASVINLISPAPANPLNQWEYVTAVYNGYMGLMQIYVDGQLVSQLPTSVRPFQDLDPSYDPGVAIGNTESGFNSQPEPFDGLIDELTVYGRSLSASEIKAIYDAGSGGKFDPAIFISSPAQSLAEAVVTIPGISTNVMLGDNDNWQQQTITFTATQTTTPLVISGMEPGMLLDSFNISGAAEYALNYLPEQSIDSLVGTSAYGEWHLEVLDNRAGATNDATLVSWQLEFTFANTNLPASSNVLGSLEGGLAQTNNNAAAASLTWYAVNVPTNASFATNLLLFAGAPVNVWFSTNTPPTITNTPADVNLIPNSTNNTAGPAILTTNTASWPYIIPGATYYLGVENTNGVPVNYALEVDFDHGNSTNSTLPQLVFSSVTISSGSLQLSWPLTGGKTYQVQWKDSLAGAWNTITNPVTTTSNGVATFVDDGSQSAPPGPMRFYRLVQLP